ncbi:hypothetical protein LG272_11405 [Pseudidiomarina marina]|uniref:hypothetical protein n=1 Tax=Pseudidiomarina marina TaxID=502366 RepID=UPI00384B461C
MKTTLTKSLTALTLTTALTVINVSTAQAETVEVRGQINYGYSFTPAGVTQYDSGEYVLEITQRPQMPLVYAASTWRQYSDAIERVTVSIYDSEGNALSVRQPLAASELVEPTNTLYFDYGYRSNYTSWTMNGMSQDGLNSQLNLNLRGPRDSLFASTAEFPRFVNTPRYVNATLFSNVETAEGDDVVYLYGPVTEVNYLTADSDGDGINDDVDACPTSDISHSVVVDATDTGVTNSVDSVGCSVTDKVLACEADANNRGDYVSCVSHLAKQLRKEGVISNSDHGALLRHL